ncbi:hypothetical protein EON80_16850 [bacterium]|nr:MAG: hypothetical protein EON80_16850 [bacterium]
MTRKTKEERQEYENRLAAAFQRKPRQFVRAFGDLATEVPDGFYDVHVSEPVSPENFLPSTSRPTPKRAYNK